MSDYGPECTGGLVSAAGTSFFNITLPFVSSLCSPAQVEKGDKYRKDSQELLEQYFDRFKEHTKGEIRAQLRRIEETKKRVDHTAWLYQKQARIYRQLSEKLYHYVNDLSNQVKMKALFERNNMSYDTINTVIPDPDNSDAIPLDSMRAQTSSRALAQVPSVLKARPKATSSPASHSVHHSTSNCIDIHPPDAPSHATGLPSRPEAARTRAVATITAANVNATITAANANASDESLGLRRLFPTRT